MSKIYIFEINPFNFEESFKFHVKVIPPKWKVFFCQSRNKPCNTLKHTTFHHTEKQIYFFIFDTCPGIELTKFCTIFWSCCPYSILNCLNYNLITLCTLSSFALLMITPSIFFLAFHYLETLIFLRWGKASVILSCEE